MTSTELLNATETLGAAIDAVITDGIAHGLSPLDAVKAARNLLLISAAALDGKISRQAGTL